MKWSNIAVSVILVALTTGTGANVFEDVTSTAGFIGLNSSWGSAWADIDNDGDLDVITLGHVQLGTNSITQVWRNNGDGTFSDVTVEVGYWHENGDAHGVVWGDFDNDGDQDFYVAKGTSKTLPDQENQRHDLMQNNGDGTFINISEEAGAQGIAHRGRGSYAFDYDVDGDLDIFFTGYTRIRYDRGNSLLQNNGLMDFIDVASNAGIERNGEVSRTASWADYNNDNYPDLLIMYPCALYTNQGDGTFIDTTTVSGIFSTNDCASSAWADYDNDGLLDVYITSGENAKIPQTTTGFLYHNNGDGTFSDVTANSGTDNPFNARGVVWGDYNNDGFQDLYIVNDTNHNPNRLLKNLGNGSFTDMTQDTYAEGYVDTGMAVDATFIDYNNDGSLDIFTTNGRANRVGNYLLMKNHGNQNNWLKIQLIGNESNRDGLMARVRVTTSEGTQIRESNGPTHYMNQDNLPLHFGLGKAGSINHLTINWPNSGLQSAGNLGVNQSVVIVEGQSIVRGRPDTSNDPGCYAYLTNLDWHLSCIGDPDMRYDFTGQIISNNIITSVNPVDLEKNDSIQWEGNVITFDFHSRWRSDAISFRTKGDVLTFDLIQNNKHEPRDFHIGKFKISPASLPVTLNRDPHP